LHINLNHDLFSALQNASHFSLHIAHFTFYIVWQLVNAPM